MVKQTGTSTDGVIDCACVIHSTGYDWQYVDRLYSMLSRNLSGKIRMHVYTEKSRSVPSHMIKHVLHEWPGLGGPKRSWWYKMQLFNPAHFRGQLLYFDLDCVILRDLSWITALDRSLFWAIRDFKYLQRPGAVGINSSTMWFNTERYAWLWDQFNSVPIEQARAGCQGDQDYLTKNLDLSQLRFFEDRYFQSYRWQCLDGGYDFRYRRHREPGTGVKIAPDTAVVVFHGSPNPHQVQDPVITELWR